MPRLIDRAAARGVCRNCQPERRHENDGLPWRRRIRWERGCGVIPKHRKRKMVPKMDGPREIERRRLYDLGLGDKDIATQSGLTGNAIAQWRKLRGLPANRPQALDEGQQAARLLLYQMGYGDHQIAKETGMLPNTVTAWRMRRGLSRNMPATKATGKAKSVKETIYARIKRAIGRSLPPDIAGDAVADLCVAVLEGRVDLDAIEAQARKFGNRVLGQFASKFGPRSLDEELGDDDGFRMIDLIRDDSSSSWLEEMGATVW